MLKKVLIILNSKQTKEFYLCSFLNFFHAILELFALGSLAGIVLLVINPNDLIIKINSLKLYSKLIESKIDLLSNLNVILYIFISIFLISTIFKFFIKYYTIKFSIRLSYQLGEMLFKNYIKKKYIFFFNDTSASLISLTNYHSAKFTNSIVNPLMNLINSFSLIIILLISLIYVGGLKTVIALFFIFFISLSIYLFLRKRISLNEKNIIECDAKKNAILNESFYNIKYLKLSKKYLYKLSLFEKYGKIYGKALSKNQIYLHFAKPLLEIFFLVLIVIFILIRLNSKDNNILELIPLISFFLLSFYRLIPATQIIYQSFIHIRSGLETIDIIETEISKKNLHEKEVKEVEQINFNNNINVSSIEFKFKNNKNLFDKVSLEIKKNSCVAFFGKSGQGKTTLVDIICGLIEPSNGYISVDNIKINSKNINSFQNKIGYLGQNFYIINDTLMNNIILDDEPTVANFKKGRFIFSELFDEFELKDLINSNENVGENGIKLSHGQKQRLLIVRLLYSNKEILILDEPTSSLDNKNIIKLKNILSNLKITKTIIITTHNKDILQVCDQIFFIDNSKIEKISENDLKKI